ncbi:STM3941 family protein [Sphingomonas koreensis]
MSERLVARVSKGKTIFLLLLAAGFVTMGFWMVGSAEEIAASNRRAFFDDPAMTRAVGWIAILFFGACAIVIFRQLFRVEPVMVIDERGILWRRWSDQVIPWSAIVRAEPNSIHYQKFLCLWLDAPERYPPRSTLGKFSGINKGMGFGDLALAMQGTDQSFKRLLKVVDAHLSARDHRVGTGSAPE